MRCFIYSIVLLYLFYLILEFWGGSFPKILLSIPIVASLLPCVAMWLSNIMRKPRVVIINDTGFKDSSYGEGIWGKPYVRWWFIWRITLERNNQKPDYFRLIIITWLGKKSIHVFSKAYSEIINELHHRGKL